jgi:hypothetical protein
VLVPISSTNPSGSASTFSATIVRQAALKNSSRFVAPTVLFSAKAQAPQNPPDGRVADASIREVIQKAASLGDSRGRAPLDVLFEEFSSFLVYPRRSSRTLLRGERASLASDPGVALHGGHGGEAHIEQAGSLGFGHTTLDGFNYLVAQVFGVSFHFPMIASGSMFMASAVEGDAAPGLDGIEMG